MKEESSKEYTLVCNDWCIDFPTTKEVKIDDNKYIGYKIQWRFGSNWWVCGIRKNDNFRQDDFGEVSYRELIKFMKWAGERIYEFSSITTNMNFIKELTDLMFLIKEEQNES
ncbi:MAG: hypothetical protein IJ842_02080 [Bacilli bacterium]|nr:hypothetical protein [Bacilli bacterium]